MPIPFCPAIHEVSFRPESQAVLLEGAGDKLAVLVSWCSHA